MLPSKDIGWMQQKVVDVDEVGKVCQQLSHAKIWERQTRKEGYPKAQS